MATRFHPQRITEQETTAIHGRYPCSDAPASPQLMSGANAALLTSNKVFSRTHQAAVKPDALLIHTQTGIITLNLSSVHNYGGIVN